MRRAVAATALVAGVVLGLPVSSYGLTLGHWTRLTSTANGYGRAAVMTAPSGFTAIANGCAGGSHNLKVKIAWTTNATPGTPTYTAGWSGPSTGSSTVTTGSNVTVSGDGTFTFTLTAGLGTHWTDAATNHPTVSNTC